MSTSDVLKTERDRFIAFSFAAADALIQTDARGLITFASGATKALTGFSADELMGASVLSFIPTHDRLVLRQFLDTIKKGGRLQPFLLHVVPTAKVSIPVIIGACRLPDDPHTYFAITSARRLMFTDDKDVNRSQSSGLLTQNLFIEKASLLFTSKTMRIDSLRLTLIDVSADEALWQDIHQAAGKDFYSHFGAYLRSISVGGDLAAKLAPGKFIVLHSENQGELEIQHYIEHLQHSFLKETHINPTLETLQLALGDGRFPTSDTIKSLLYTCQQFVGNGLASISYGSLAEAIDGMIEDRKISLDTNFSEKFSYPFHLVYQPIVKLDDKSLHHFEALSRFQCQKSPFEMITYAEEVGLTESFDMAVCHKVITMLYELRKVGRCPYIAMNVSAHSLESMLFVASLRALLAKVDSKLRPFIMFEVTESGRIQNYDMVNKVLQILRRDGHQVCLDDMGSGLTTFSYMRSLKVDYVKIDGTFIHGLEKSERDRAFVKAMTQLCAELKVKVIAEMVETEGQAAALRGLNVSLAQGYLFGKPSPLILDYLPTPA